MDCFTFATVKIFFPHRYTIFYVYLVKTVNNEVARSAAALRSHVLLLPKSISLSFLHEKKDKNRCPCPFSLYSILFFYELLYGRL